MKARKIIAAWKMKGIIQRAILKNCPEIVITLFPPEGKSEGIEIFVSLSGVSYNGIETEGDIEGDIEKGNCREMNSKIGNLSEWRIVVCLMAYLLDKILIFSLKREDFLPFFLWQKLKNFYILNMSEATHESVRLF